MNNSTNSHYTPLPQPTIVTEHNWANGTLPLASVRCITYNHGKYIESAIKSFLIQKTTFPIQIAIYDDASTDGTSEIVRQYQEKYPDLIHAVLQKENQHSKGVKPSRLIGHLIKGKYVASCEGDDYWIDELKLEKQVGFLEENSDYSLCHSEYDLDNQVHGKYTKKYGLTMGWNFDLTDDMPARVLNREYEITTCTTCYPRELRERIRSENAPDFDPKFKMGDTQFFFHLARHGKIKYFPESMAVYRKVAGSATSFDNKLKRYRFLENAYLMKCEVAERHKLEDLLPRIHNKYVPLLANLAKRNLDRKGFLEYTKKADLYNINLGWKTKLWKILSKNSITFKSATFLAQIKRLGSSVINVRVSKGSWDRMT